jgi:hypothetical protein
MQDLAGGRCQRTGTVHAAFHDGAVHNRIKADPGPPARLESLQRRIDVLGDTELDGKWL